MPTAFEVLYDTALTLWTDERYRKLTKHHNPSVDEVESLLQASLTQFGIPGENVFDDWGRTRIFCLNFANRLRGAPATRERILELLTWVEGNHHSASQRVAALYDDIADWTYEHDLIDASIASAFEAAVQKWVSPDIYEDLGDRTILQWVDSRINHWGQCPLRDVYAMELLDDCEPLVDGIPLMDLPLAMDLFAALAGPAFCKLERSVVSVIGALTFGSDHRYVAYGLTHIAKRDDRALSGNRRFAWLHRVGGVWPQVLSRLIYLVGSDDLNLDGNRNAGKVVFRQEMMKGALIRAGLLSSAYIHPEGQFAD